MDSGGHGVTPGGFELLFCTGSSSCFVGHSQFLGPQGPRPCLEPHVVSTGTSGLTVLLSTRGPQGHCCWKTSSLTWNSALTATAAREQQAPHAV